MTQIIEVALNIPLNRVFDYTIDTEDNIEIGCRVLVPFGNQEKIGVIVTIKDKSEIPTNQLKSIIKLIDQHSIYDTNIYQLLYWASNYYHTSFGEVLLQAIPNKLRKGSPLNSTITKYYLTEKGVLALNGSAEIKLTSKQKEALQWINLNSTVDAKIKITKSIINALLTKELIYKSESTTELTTSNWYQQVPTLTRVNLADKHKLNTEQALVISKILNTEDSQLKPFLLYGVTGSGKTEVYFNIIEKSLEQQQQILYLIPEIGLTPQLINRFKARFNVPIASFHSNLNENEKLTIWKQVKNEQLAIIIGTRSSIFMQFKNLGLIIVDEEHDDSYKQQDAWCYNARDLSIIRAYNQKIPVILGSATPSLESLYNVEQKKYTLLKLTSKAENNLPLKKLLVDLKHKTLTAGLTEYSLSLIKEHLAKGNQVLIFLNKRGYSPVLFCHECGYIFKCDNCDKAFTYHQARQVLQCHHCSKQILVPKHCLSCNSANLVTVGLGTEQLAETLQTIFNQYPIMRIDRDTIRQKGELTKKLNDITNNKYPLLIGTQLISKGHHFPNLTLVVVLNIDGAFFATDFRAEEKFAQQFIQVAGRAGRANKQGELILQTYYPQHPLILLLLKEGYLAFAKQILKTRKEANLPPYSYQTILKARHPNLKLLQKELTNFQNILTSIIKQHNLINVQAIGPQPATNHKIAGQFRYFILINAQYRHQIQLIIKEFNKNINLINSSKIKWYFDVDPYDFN